MTGYNPGDLVLGPNTMAITRLLHELRHNALTPQAVVAFGLKTYAVVAGERQLGFADMLHAFVEAQDVIAFWRKQHPDEISKTVADHALRIMGTIFGHSLPAASNGRAILREVQLHSNRTAERVPQHFEPGMLAHERVRGLEVLLNYYGQKINGITVVQDYLPDTTQWLLTDKAVQRYDEQATELAGYLAAYSAYTVKPCFTQDGMLHGPEYAHVILDGPELYDKIGQVSRAGYVTPMAAVHLTERSKITSTELRYTRKDPYRRMDTLSPEYPILLGFDVQQDGTLTMDNYGFVPLNYIFNLAGRPEVYPLFRLMQLLRLSDLVISVTKRREHNIPSLPVLSGTQRTREKQIRNLVQEFPKLWLPRVRALADHTTAGTIEQEIEQDKALTDRATRKVGRREGHWRRLLPGQKATPEAIANAKRERGKEPPKDHTYVKLRKGDGPGHEVRRRSR